ncbi:DUF853 family protein [Georgenia halophila]|uniref:DUF853 family protein n=2 Tax=Georgenia halophila TaxID=620889 RepID=A0ABP8LHQ9_9MICO
MTDILAGALSGPLCHQHLTEVTRQGATRDVFDHQPNATNNEHRRRPRRGAPRLAQDCVLAVAADAAGYGIASITGHGVLAVACAVGTVLAAAAVCVFGHRGVKRAELAPDFISKLLETVEKRLELEMTVKTHDRRRWPATSNDDGEVDPIEERARKTLPQLLGASTKLAAEKNQAGELIAVTASHSVGVKVAAAGYRLRVERSISTMLSGRWKASWDLTEDTVTFRLRPTFPKSVPHRREPIASENLFKLPIAVDEDGHIVRWDLTAGGPHALLSGKTGKGKTVLINGVVMEAAMRGWPVWIADPKPVEFMAMRSWPNVQLVATDVVEIIAMLKLAHDEMERRYAQIDDGVDESGFEPLTVVVDEFRNLVRQIDDWWARVRAHQKGLPTSCPVHGWLPTLAEKARTAKIHLLVGTQRPDATFLGEGMRDNFDTRFSLGPLSPQGAQMMWEAPHLGVAVPRHARGRGTARLEDDRIDEVQVLWTPDPRRASSPEVLRILEDLKPDRAVHDRLAIDLGDESDLEGAEISEWTRIREARLVPAEAVTENVRVSGDGVTTSTPGKETHGAGHAISGSGPRPDVALVDAMHEVEDTGEAPADESQDGYGEHSHVASSRVSAGDLLLVDEDLWLWAMVEDAQDDLVDDGNICIDWRTDDDESGSLSLPAAEVVTIRSPLEPDAAAADVR